jgi:hypothetical protein
MCGKAEIYVDKQMRRLSYDLLSHDEISKISVALNLRYFTTITTCQIPGDKISILFYFVK